MSPTDLDDLMFAVRYAAQREERNGETKRPFSKLLAALTNAEPAQPH